MLSKMEVTFWITLTLKHAKIYIDKVKNKTNHEVIKTIIYKILSVLLFPSLLLIISHFCW